MSPAAHRIIGSFFVVLAVGFFPPATIAQNAGRSSIHVAGKTLALIGRGVREFLFVDIYKMAAYSESGSCRPQQITGNDEIKSIRLSMVRKIPAKRMNATLRKSLHGNMEDPNDEAMKRTIRSFLSLFKGDLVSGTFIEILYIPGTGTVVKRDGKKLGITPGRSFHELLWKSYFGKNTCCSDLKKSILKMCNR